MDNNELLDNLKLIVGDTQVRTGEPMNIHTTFRIGGCADYYVQPSSIEELQSLIQFLNKSDIEYCVIGNGSNLLVSDKGIRGVVIQLSDTFDEVKSPKTGAYVFDERMVPNEAVKDFFK